MSEVISAETLDILIEKVKNGDELAFEEIYNRCYGHITFVCSKLCNNKQNVEEIVQDTMLVASRKIHELRGDTFMAYLRKVATHGCFLKHKQNSRRPEYVPYTDEAMENIPELDSDFLPEEYLQKKETQEMLLRAINKLPQKQRKIIYMYFYAGINTNEIATLLDMQSATVRKILQRSKDILRDRLSAEGYRPASNKAVLPLAALLFVEEAAFVTGNAIPVTAAGTGIMAAAAAAKVYVIAIAVAGIATAATLYFAINSPHEETLTVIATEATPPAETEIIPVAATTVLIELPTTAPPTEYHTEPATVAITIPEATTEPLTNPPTEPETVPLTTPPATIPETTPPETEPITQPITEPPPTQPETIPPTEPAELPTEPYTEPPTEPEPEPIDPTPAILTALATATTVNDLNHIIHYFNFALCRQMRNTDSEIFRFYILTTATGEILIGTMAHESGANWQMQYELFTSSPAPVDILQRLEWIGVDI